MTAEEKIIEGTKETLFQAVIIYILCDFYGGSDESKAKWMKWINIQIREIQFWEKYVLKQKIGTL